MERMNKEFHSIWLKIHVNKAIKLWKTIQSRRKTQGWSKGKKALKRIYKLEENNLWKK